MANEVASSHELGVAITGRAASEMSRLIWPFLSLKDKFAGEDIVVQAVNGSAGMTVVTEKINDKAGIERVSIICNLADGNMALISFVPGLFAPVIKGSIGSKIGKTDEGLLFEEITNREVLIGVFSQIAYRIDSNYRQREARKIRQNS